MRGVQRQLIDPRVDPLRLATEATGHVVYALAGGRFTRMEIRK